MPEETLLAFDYGTRKIGVAVGNTVTRQARPLVVLKPATREARFQAIEALLHQWQPARVVVGLPLTLEGEEQYASLQSRRFANQLHGRFGLAVELVDERGSSMEAQNLLGAAQGDDDAMAAAVILRRYLEKR
ncbi:Holliday junction resolvase RuvX [Pusillimonas sp. CC-YST705]|uniref:Putative pre-16S rRNA nuclease n=1 Tax=Mesopusillimonas faecipullorum TaxID=2755040 RepID=A0ABS8C9D9_9BURK|nr:Holliday junction resolvase RuvX [Mesopusillimonas faecipullorum]MCB5362647.1 Holliday junction resolvase RuvX [Mesopusillimonas faecipullorum]